MRVYNDVHTAYLGTLADVLDNPDYVCAPRGQEIYEKVNYQFKILNPVAEPIKTLDPERNSVIERYTIQEMELYNSCSNRVEDFAKASKFWEKLANPDGTINSGYGYLIFADKSCGNHVYELAPAYGGKVPLFSSDPAFISQKDACYRTPFEWAKECLIRDKDTRQATMPFSQPQHRWMGNKDQVCTIYGNWLIRDDQLNLFIAMRSNDVTLGICYDICFFVSLIDKMLDELKPHYPNLKKGTYTHLANSYHAYVKDFPKIKKMLGRNE